MNFFEKELRKCANAFDNTKFIGNALYIKLGENNRLKLQFVTFGTHQQYEGIRLTALDKNSGTIDNTTIKFADIWGVKKINNPNFCDGFSPYAWTYNGKTEWYVYIPNSADYEMLSEKIDDYTEIFMEQTDKPTQRQGFGYSMSEQM